MIKSKQVLDSQPHQSGCTNRKAPQEYVKEVFLKGAIEVLWYRKEGQLMLCAGAVRSLVTYLETLDANKNHEVPLSEHLRKHSK